MKEAVVVTLPDQSWFWTTQWQAGEREASAQIAAGETTVYGSDAEFVAALDAISSRSTTATPDVSIEDTAL